MFPRASSYGPNGQRAAAHEPDYALIASFGLLVLFGLVMLASASAPVGYERFGDSYFFIKRQMLFGVLPGLALLFLFAHIHHRHWLRFFGLVYIGAILLLLAVFIPGIGSTLNTAAKSWLQLGSYSIQPAEIAKLAFVIFLAGSLGALKSMDSADYRRHMIQSLGLGGGLIALVLLQPDLGTATILFAILFGMLFIAGARMMDLTALAAIGILGFVVMIAVAPYRAARLMTFLHPELDPQGIGYHINQAHMAIGSGGIFGLGLGHSRQKFQYLPEVHADSIFAVIAEEMGFVITLGLIALLVYISYRALRIAERSAPPAKLLASGIVIWFLVQSFFNMGAMVGLLPLTGVPIPFVSHGGTALMMAMAAVGMLINVSKHT